jgi:hypothetical protein
MIVKSKQAGELNGQTDRELSADELDRISGGWSVDTLVGIANAQKNAGSGSSGESLTLNFTRISFSPSPL